MTEIAAANADRTRANCTNLAIANASRQLQCLGPAGCIDTRRESTFVCYGRSNRVIVDLVANLTCFGEHGIAEVGESVRTNGRWLSGTENRKPTGRSETVTFEHADG